MARTVTDTNIVRKEKNDFNTYQRFNRQSLVDWGQTAKDITKTFTDIRDDRERRKTEIETSYRDQQSELNDQGQYESTTVQQFVMNGANAVAEKTTNMYDMVKRGLVKPADYALFRQNVSNGFKQVKANAASIDKEYQEFAKRSLLNEKGITTNAEKERWIANQLKSFANLKNASLVADDITGELSFVRLDEKGKVIPGETKSLAQISSLLKQRVNNVDVKAEVKKAKESLGTIVRTSLKRRGLDYEITSEAYQSAQNEFLDNEDGKETVRKLAQEMGAGENATTILTNNNIRTSTGEKYTVGTREEHLKFEKDNPPITTYEAAEITNTAEGNKFREWVRNKYGNTEIKDEFDLDAKGSIDFKGFIEAYEKYGEEYSKEKGIGTEIVKKVENPIVIQEYDPTTMQYESRITEDQRKVQEDYIVDKINTALDYKQTTVLKGVTQGRSTQPTSAQIKLMKERQDKFNDAGKVRDVIEGDINTANSAAAYIKNKYNRNKKQGQPEMTRFKRVDRKATANDVKNNHAQKEGDMISVYEVKYKGKPVETVYGFTNDGEVSNIDIFDALLPQAFPNINSSELKDLGFYSKAFSGKKGKGGAGSQSLYKYTLAEHPNKLYFKQQVGNKIKNDWGTFDDYFKKQKEANPTNQTTDIGHAWAATRDMLDLTYFIPTEFKGELKRKYTTPYWVGIKKDANNKNTNTLLIGIGADRIEVPLSEIQNNYNAYGEKIKSFIQEQIEKETGVTMTGGKPKAYE